MMTKRHLSEARNRSATSFTIQPRRTTWRTASSLNSAMIVADASAVVEFLLGGPRGITVEAFFVKEEGRLQAPAML